MLSCKEATRLMSEEQDRPLTFQERAALKLHTMMCLGCTNYRKQIAFLGRATARLRKGLFDGD